MDIGNAGQSAGCVLMDTAPNVDVGEVICIHNNGLIEVLDAATMGSGGITKHLADGKVNLGNPTKVLVVTERVNNQLFIEVDNQFFGPVTTIAMAGNVGFLLVGDQGSVKMTDIELSTAA